jgi:Core-2/I-Branching enzyme
MTLAYCIAAHARPAQCQRLVQRLLDDDPQCRVFFHYDQRNSHFDFAQVTGPRVRVVRERPVYWGGAQVVDLFLDMFRQAVGEGCSYVVMLSGQDYPLRHVGDLEAELAAYDVWADCNPLFANDGSCNWPEGRRRYSYWWWHFDRPAKLTRGADRFAEKVLHVPLSRRETPLPYLVRCRMDNQVWWGAKSRGPGVPIYTGSMWMNLSVPAVEVLLACPRRVASFFHHVPIADEAYFHTVLRNAAGLAFAPGDARYTRWAEGQPHPEVLTTGDLDKIVASGAHFARKFDDDVDSSVLGYLDIRSYASGSPDVQVADGSSPT